MASVILRALSGRRHAELPTHYPGVLVPLHEAHLHSYSARTAAVVSRDGEEARLRGIDGKNPERRDEENNDNDNDDDDDRAQYGGETRGMLKMSATEYTIEGLRREVRRGGGDVDRRWTQYERALSVVLLLRLPTTPVPCAVSPVVMRRRLRGLTQRHDDRRNSQV